MQASFQQHLLNFKRPAGTSRGILNTKETFLLEIIDGDRKGIGECAVFRGLSSDDVPEYESKLKWLVHNINLSEEEIHQELIKFPSIWFGYEQAIRNLKYGENLYFPSDFTDGKTFIKINGLIWMGDSNFMKEQIRNKLEQNFSCIKLKIGVNWKIERKILQELRKEFPADVIELRVDANGGFTFEEVPKVLEELRELEIHSIEQPIQAGNIKQMCELCKNTPTPIALDEELIGIYKIDEKKNLLEQIQPQYIILKPSLVGGFHGTNEWISIAEEQNIGWWITSALESNIGLNAIAQYTYTKKSPLPQGLGTGALFTNNFESALSLEGENLFFHKK